MFWIDAYSIWINNVFWWGTALVIAAALLTALRYGIQRFHTTSGKCIVVFSGLGLLSLILFVSGVMLIVWSGNQGHPF